MTYEGKIIPRRDQTLAEETVDRESRSFTGKVALRMVVFASCATAIIALFSFFVAKQEAERALLAEWQVQIEQRGRYESRRLNRAEELTDRLAERFLSNYINPSIAPLPEFDAYFDHMADGTVRLRPEFHSGYRDASGLWRGGVSGFIARNRPPLARELQRRLILAYEAVAEFGPGASADFANVHASLPENALIIHWPEEPWGLQAASDLDMTAQSVLQATLQANNAERKPVWTGLYFDATALNWTITFERPVDWQGRHLINASVDVSLTDLIGDVVRDEPNGVFDLIISRDGMLVAHPRGLEGLRRDAGQISIDEVESPGIASIYRDLASSGPGSDGTARVVFNHELNAYVAGVGLEGPEWWLVTVYPQAEVENRALRSAGLILLLIALLFGAFILTVILVLRTSVAAPIQKMTAASRRLANGDYASVAKGDRSLPTDRDDEIGTLARSFRRMAGKVDDMRDGLERLVAARTLELELANQQLEEQSRRDALTGALNRRAFNQDLEQAVQDVETNGAKIALALFDVDFFKPYNDHYGHVAGDKVLERVVGRIAASLPTATIYRYGGEEIAAIISCSDGRDPVSTISSAVSDVEDLEIAHSRSPFGRLTVSAGGMSLRKPAQEHSRILEQVDAALYSAKEAGRNRSEWSDPATCLAG